MAPLARRWRVILVAAFAIQAFIVVFVSLALVSARHGQPAPAAATPAPVITAQLPVVIYPMHLVFTVHVAAGGSIIAVPMMSRESPSPISVPAGQAELVSVTVINPGPGSASDVRFGINREPDLHSLPAPLGTPFCCGFSWISKGAQLPPGTSTFRFLVPASDLQRGHFPVIVAGVLEGSYQPAYPLVQLNPGQ